MVLLIIVVYVDDIIFWGNDEASKIILEKMKNESKMIMMGKMKYF